MFLKVFIPRYHLRDGQAGLEPATFVHSPGTGQAKPFYVYELEISIYGKFTKLYKRYSQFLALHNEVCYNEHKVAFVGHCKKWLGFVSVAEKLPHPRIPAQETAEIQSEGVGNEENRLGELHILFYENESSPTSVVELSGGSER